MFTGPEIVLQNFLQFLKMYLFCTMFVVQIAQQFDNHCGGIKLEYSFTSYKRLSSVRGVFRHISSVEPLCRLNNEHVSKHVSTCYKWSLAEINYRVYNNLNFRKHDIWWRTYIVGVPNIQYPESITNESATYWFQRSISEESKDAYQM